MIFLFNRLLFIIILSSTSKITLSHEFWIDPVNFYIKDNEILKANIIIGENYEGSKIAFSKKDFKNLKLHSKNDSLKIKGRLGDIPAINIKKTFTGLNIIQIESEINYADYEGLLKFEVFSIKKGYLYLIIIHNLYYLSLIQFVLYFSQ